MLRDYPNLLVLTIFFSVFILLSGCFFETSKVYEPWEYTVVNTTVDNNRMLYRLTFNTIEVEGLQIGREIVYDVTYNRKLVPKKTQGTLDIDTHVAYTYDDFRQDLDDQLRACKNALSYPTLVGCDLNSRCMELCAANPVCQEFVAVNGFAGLSRAVVLSGQLQIIETKLRQVDEQVRVKNYGLAGKFLLDEVYAELKKFERESDFSPCGKQAIDYSKLFKTHGFFTNPQLDSLDEVVYAEVIDGMNVSAQDTIFLVHNDTRTVFLLELLTYIPTEKGITSVKQEGYPVVGEMVLKGRTINYSYRGTLHNDLSNTYRFNYVLSSDSKSPNELFLGTYGMSLRYEVLPEFIDSLYMVFVIPLDTFIQKLMDILFFNNLTFTMVLILLSGYVIFYLVFSGLPFILRLGENLKVYTFEEALAKEAGKSLKNYWFYLLIGLLFIGIAFLIYKPDNTVLYSSTVDLFIVEVSRILFSKPMSIVFSLLVFFGLISLKKALVELLKRLILGKKYYLPQDQLLREELISKKKRLAELHDSVQNAMVELKAQDAEVEDFGHRLESMNLGAVFSLTDKDIRSISLSRLQSINANLTTAEANLSSLYNELVALQEKRKLEWQIWLETAKKIFDAKKTIDVSDLKDVPQPLRKAVLKELYSTLDSKKYMFVDNKIVGVPKDQLEKNVFTAIANMLLDNQNIYEFCVFTRSGEIIDDHLQKRANRSILSVVVIKLVKSAMRLIELTYATKPEFVLINLSGASIMMLWGEKKVLFFVINKNARLNEVLAKARPYLALLSDESINIEPERT